METTDNVKKPYPFASLLIVLSAIVSIVAQATTILQTYYSVTNLYTPFVFFIITLVIGVYTTIISTIRYILLAAFARDTTSKPRIPYIIVSVLITVGAFLGIILVSVFSIISYVNSTPTLTLTISSAFGIITQILFAIMFLTMLIYTIRIKKSNRPSNTAKIWYVYCVPGCLCVISMVISKFLDFLTFARYYPFDTVITGLSFLDTFIHSFKILILVAALFCVAYQFARVNKNLPVEEATEITQ